MPTAPKGEKRPADVIGNAVKVMRILTEGLFGRPQAYRPSACSFSHAADLVAIHFFASSSVLKPPSCKGALSEYTTCTYQPRPNVISVGRNSIFGLRCVIFPL